MRVGGESVSPDQDRIEANARGSDVELRGLTNDRSSGLEKSALYTTEGPGPRCESAVARDATAAAPRRTPLTKGRPRPRDRTMLVARQVS